MRSSFYKKYSIKLFSCYSIYFNFPYLIIESFSAGPYQEPREYNFFHRNYVLYTPYWMFIFVIFHNLDINTVVEFKCVSYLSLLNINILIPDI